MQLGEVVRFREGCCKADRLVQLKLWLVVQGALVMHEMHADRIIRDSRVGDFEGHAAEGHAAVVDGGRGHKDGQGIAAARQFVCL